MVHGRAEPVRVVGGRMTALARRHGRADRDVIRGWAGRMYVVVTGGAAAGDAHVGEHRPRPAERRMAGVAFEVGDDVRRPLALRHRPVVTGRAAAARLGVVEVDGRVPGDRGVAGPALIGRENVAGRLRRRAYQAADAMAGATLLRRALEDCVDVAGLAGQVAVLTRELEAGGQMVEVRVGGRRGDRWREREPEQQRRKRVHASPNALPQDRVLRSEERRVGKECRSRWAPDNEKKKESKKYILKEED